MRYPGHTLNGYVVEYGGFSGDPGTSETGGSVVVANAEFTIDRVNDAPSLSSISGIAYTENEVPKAIAPSASIGDVDQSSTFDGGFLLVEFVSGSESSDQLSLLSSSGFTVTSNDIVYAGNIIGSLHVDEFGDLLDGVDNTD